MIDIGPKPATCIQHVSFGWQKLASCETSAGNEELMVAFMYRTFATRIDGDLTCLI